MAKTAREHLATNKKPKTVILDKAFGGAQVGQKMYVATPKIIDEYIKQIPYGETQSIQEFRSNIAKNKRCSITCPLSTSIFIRIAAQAALDEMQDGVKVSEISPFWRVISSKDKIAKKLSIDGDWIDRQRELEKG